jgi:hypothetical protein
MDKSTGEGLIVAGHLGILIARAKDESCRQVGNCVAWHDPGGEHTLSDADSVG